MAQTKSVGFSSPKMMAGDGRAVWFDDKAVIAAAGAANDTIDFLLPAGQSLHQLKFIVTDMDTNGTPTLAAKIGYAPVNPASSLAGNDAYFKAAAAFGQSAQAFECDFAPVRFDEDVYIRITVTTAAATFAAGSVTMVGAGNMVGAK